MRKIYMSLLAAALVTGATAQHANLDIQPIRKNIEIGNKVKPGNVGQVKGATVWTNDFSTPSEWTRTNTSNPAQNWWITSDPNQIPVSALAPAAFSTFSNGYGFINSDSAGSTATQNANLTLATAIDLASLSSATNFSLVFEHSYRTYLDTRIVRVSGDGGSTWTDYTITDGSDAGTNSANPAMASLNITSAVAPGGIVSNNVLIEFNYQAAWGWYWAVDDVKIVETDDNDLRLEEASFGSTGSWGARLPYYQVPTDQIMPVTYWASVTNIGAVDQMNTVVDVDVNSGTFTGSSAAGFTSLVGSMDTLELTANYTPSGTPGTHTAAYNVSSANVDSDLSNNSGTSTFEVTNYVYARDNGTIAGGSYNQGEAYEVGNIFDIVNTTTLYAANITIAASSEGSPFIYAKLYSIDATTGDFIFMEQSDDYAVASSEFGTEITLPLLSPQTLNGGEAYLLVVGTYGDGGATSDLVTGTAGDSEAQTTFYFDGTDQTWYYTTSTPMVRMNFEPVPPTVSFNSTAVTVSEGSTASVVLNISEAPTADVTVDVSVTGGTATSGSDYTFTSPTTVTFPAGSSSSQTVSIPITFDDQGESDETILLGLSNVSSNGQASTATATVTISANVSVEENDGNISVGQNYPNPFNGNTTINYSLVNTDNVTVEITDLTGKVIAVMNEGVKTAGNHTVEINSNGLAAGTYYYSIVTSNGKVTKAMNVAK